MDQWSLAVANTLVGNERGAAGLEWAIGGGSLRFGDDANIAMAGADVEATLDGSPVTTGGQISARAGQALEIRRLSTRRFLYIAVSGGVNCPPVLGSRSTYLPAALGGIEGRRLRKGDVFLIGKRRVDRVGAAAIGTVDRAAPDYDAHAIRVVSSEADGFGDFFATSYTVSAASDRMGYRLEGNRPLEGGASIISDPVCAGVIQLPPDGHPIVLMADSPTVGGYRIIGTVITCDLPILAQTLPGRSLRFAAVSVDIAQEELRRRESALSKMRGDAPPSPDEHT
jgi:antagonist of KipI